MRDVNKFSIEKLLKIPEVVEQSTAKPFQIMHYRNHIYALSVKIPLLS